MDLLALVKFYLMVEKDGIDDPVSKGRKIVKPGVPLTPAGKSGIEISENFPHLRKHADDLCLLNGMKSKTGNHNQARTLLHTGNNCKANGRSVPLVLSAKMV